MHTYDSGTFIVGSTGEVDVDFLFDGGWFRGEIGLFNVEGMESLTPGSEAFMLEAARRALSNSDQGRIVNQDEIEGARFSTSDFNWERDFNTGEYIGAKEFTFNPGDELGLMMVQHKTIQETFDNPDRINEFGRLPLFSIPEANIGGALPGQFEFVGIPENGIIAGEDMRIFQADGDYNDVVLQFRGLELNYANLDDHINPTRDFRDYPVGEDLLAYAEDRVLNENDPGVFQVDESGEVNIDYLYDGGVYEGAVGIVSLEGINPEDINTEEFTAEVVRRVQSNSNQGHIIIDDKIEGAKFSYPLEWEEALPEGKDHFNEGDYSGQKTFTMTPGDYFALVMIPDGSFENAVGVPESVLIYDLMYSFPEANYENQVQFVDVRTSAGGTIASFEDNRIDRPSNEDFNDIVLAIEGINEPIGLSSIEDYIFPERNWLERPIGTDDILPHFDSLAA